MVPRAIYSVAIIPLLISGSANAMCLGGRHPSLEEEARNSSAIVIGVVQSISDLSEDLSDPGGVTATLYTVKVTRRLKGKMKHLVQIRSENTSSRFVMEKNQRYRLFLSAAGNEYIVDSCGNSSAMN